MHKERGQVLLRTKHPGVKIPPPEIRLEPKGTSPPPNLMEKSLTSEIKDYGATVKGSEISSGLSQEVWVLVSALPLTCLMT